MGLIQANGDPVADLLYTANFAFLGLHEANRLAGFLCRIQVRSERHPELDGWWVRAFEFRRWDYWASKADAGWGAWSTENGWTQACITAVLGMRRMHTSLRDVSAGSTIGRHIDRLAAEMLPAELRR